MLRENGGVIADLIVSSMNDRWYPLVVNAGTRDKDIEWLRQVAALAPSFDPDAVGR